MQLNNRQFQVESRMRERVKTILMKETEPSASASSDSLLSGALCMALAFINRKRQETPVGQPQIPARILVRLVLSKHCRYEY